MHIVIFITMYYQVKIAAVKLVSRGHLTTISSSIVGFSCNDMHLEGVHLNRKRLILLVFDFQAFLKNIKVVYYITAWH